MAGTRRHRGGLEAEVKRITDAWITGEYAVPKNKPLTAHRVAQAMKELDGLEVLPSSGGISYVFDHWREIGFAVFSTKPYAFVDYTPAGREEGLALLTKTARDTRRAARRAAKSTTPTEPAEPVLPVAELASSAVQ